MKILAPGKGKMLKRAIAVFIAIAMVATLGASTVAFADTTTTDSGSGSASGTVGIQGTFLPLNVSITHAIQQTFSVDPNTGTFVSNPISITNNTKVPIIIGVASLNTTTGGSLTMTNVAPTFFPDWTTLSLAQTKTDIALGLKINTATGWNAGYNTNTIWGTDALPETLGTIASNGTANVNLVADYGLAWDNTYTSMANVGLSVSLS